MSIGLDQTATRQLAARTAEDLRSALSTNLTFPSYLVCRVLRARHPPLPPPVSSAPLHLAATSLRGLRHPLRRGQQLRCTTLIPRASPRKLSPTSFLRSSYGTWPVSRFAFQGPFPLSRGWSSLTETDKSSPTTTGNSGDSGANFASDRDSVRCEAGRNGNGNGNGSGNAGFAPRYDTYIPLPSAVGVAVLPEARSPWSAVPDSNLGSDLTLQPPAPPPPAITWWPPAPAAMTTTEVHGTAQAAAAPAPAPARDPFLEDMRELAAEAAAAAAAATAAANGSGSGAAAGGGVFVEGDKSAPAVDVTRHNFAVMLPVVRRYLAACDFFSFDCEMTGLFLEGQKEEFLDDLQDRYSRTAMAAQAFVINQFGLSCFKRQEGAGPDGEKRYLAATFNFYLFPRPPEGGNSSASSVTSRRFVCDAGSLAFLASQGFDFNRCIYDGVTFMPVRQRDDLMRQVERENGGGGGGGGFHNSSGDVALTKPEDRDFVEGLLCTVRQWLESGSQEPLDLPPVNRYLRLLTYQALARPESFGGPPGGAADWHPGFYVKKVQDERNFTALRLVRVAGGEEAAALEAAERAARREGVAAAAGFAAVWEAMRECGRPAVGHNCMFDVAYGIAQFGDGRLPATWQAFKSVVAHWFRGGLYDTKHICRQLPDLLGSDTTLGVMYGALQQEQGGNQGPGSSAASLLLSLAPLPARVSVSHARGFEKYVAVAAGQLAHEAGYDAFMTGSVFAALEAVLEARNSNGGAASASAAQPYAAVTPYAWRLNVTRSDLPYAVLRPAVPDDPSSLDPVPERPLVVYLSSLGPGVRLNDIQRACEEAGLGRPRITFQPGNNALLELERPEAAEAAVAGALQGLSAEVLSYADYRARKDAMLAAGTWHLPGFYGQRGTWAGGAGASPGGRFGAGAGAAAAPAGPSAAAKAAAAAAEPPPRPGKRPRVEDAEEKAEEKAAGGRGQCAIM